MPNTQSAVTWISYSPPSSFEETTAEDLTEAVRSARLGLSKQSRNDIIFT